MGRPCAFAYGALCIGVRLNTPASTFPIERARVATVYGFLTRTPTVLTSCCRVTWRCHPIEGGTPAVKCAARASYSNPAQHARREFGKDSSATRCHGSDGRALNSPPGPHSPIGRGSGLKIRPVSVRVRLGARKSPGQGIHSVRRGSRTLLTPLCNHCGPGADQRNPARHAIVAATSSADQVSHRG